MPKVSVIMPVYNTKEAYLRQAIESVLAQTFTDFEFIIINDGSNDDTAKIIDEYANDDERIKVIHQENQGQGIARNRALDISQGEYISFIDSDDFIHSQMLEVLVATAEKTNLDVIALDKFNQLSKKETFNQIIDLSNLKYTIHSNPLKHLLANTWSSSVIWNKLYRKKILHNQRFIEGIYFEDWPFVTCLFASLTKYATIPYPLYTYNDLSISTVRSTFTIKKIDDYAKGIEYVYNFFNTKEHRDMKRLVQTKRIIPSINMMINKTKRERQGQPELTKHLLEVLETLRLKKNFYIRDLSIKLDVRLFKLWLKSI